MIPIRRLRERPGLFCLLIVLASISILLPSKPCRAASDSRYYNMGNPVLRDIWVDPVRGNDRNTGVSQARALRTLEAAWNRIPRGRVLAANGFRIKLMPGDYAANTLPVYMESRYGTFRTLSSSRRRIAAD